MHSLAYYPLADVKRCAVHYHHMRECDLTTGATTSSSYTSTRALRPRSKCWRPNRCDGAPILFNDPFDVARDWRGPTYEELENAVVRRFESYLRGDGEPRTPAAVALLALARETRGDETARFFTELRFFYRLLRPRLEEHLSSFTVAWHERLPNMRILCLSSEPSSAAMWAHYAASHTGVVLQLESSDERDSCWLLAEPVRYQDEAPSLPSADQWVRGFLGETQIEWEQFLRDYQFVKQADWSYEREYRIVSGNKQTESGLYSDYLFHPEDLRGVILGAKIDPHNELAIRRLVSAKYPRAVVYRARINYGTRSIVYAPTD